MGTTICSADDRFAFANTLRPVCSIEIERSFQRPRLDNVAALFFFFFFEIC